jgi:hypothetical protein
VPVPVPVHALGSRFSALERVNGRTENVYVIVVVNVIVGVSASVIVAALGNGNDTVGVIDAVDGNDRSA